MGWIFCLIMMTMGFAIKDPLYFVAASLFGIAGSISIKKFNNKEDK